MYRETCWDILRNINREYKRRENPYNILLPFPFLLMLCFASSFLAQSRLCIHKKGFRFLQLPSLKSIELFLIKTQISICFQIMKPIQKSHSMRSLILIIKCCIKLCSTFYLSLNKILKTIFLLNMTEIIQYLSMFCLFCISRQKLEEKKFKVSIISYKIMLRFVI